ncbi:MAG: transcription elongation factor GreA [Candidatus Omnitrophota bacterium]|jgi:transcription elongation factor GreA
MSSDRIRMTETGYKKMKDDLKYMMTKKRREIAKDLEVARAFGDLKENAEYDAAKNSQAMNEHRISELNEKLSRAEILDETGMDKDKVLLGATVSLKDLETGEELKYMLVAGEEADYNENKISISSPIGKTLLGHKVGDKVDIAVPAGAIKYQVLKIER